MMHNRIRLRAAWMIGVLGLAMASPAALAQKQVLRLMLDRAVLESPSDEADLMVLFGERKPRTLLEIVQSIEKAADDAKIHGIAMIVESPGMSLAQAEELTRALRSFRDKGKTVHCYMDYAGNIGYAMAAAADHITLAENSALDVVGLLAEVSFYKNMLDKIGVQADMLRCGAYKAAAEPYIRTEPSEEFAANLNWLLDGIYDRWLGMIAEGRKLDVKAVEAAVDRGPLNAQAALDAKLVDAVGSFEDFKQLVFKTHGADARIVKSVDSRRLDFDIDPANPFALFTEMNRIMEELFGGAKPATEPGVGLVYVDGAIMVGRSDASPLMGTVAGSTSIRAALQDARQDPNVKAVVLRVDSPGGSAIASDIIWKAATQLAREKPLIVSMGSVAGSGGYYVAVPGDTIFAEESTITGSIGVVGGKLIWNELWEEKIGITTTEFQRGRHAGLMSFNRPWTTDEREWMVNFINEIYEQFKGRVTASRGSRIQGDLEDLAGGRVYTGRQALDKGLVDRIGGLADAIAYAGRKAGLSSPRVYTFPKKKGFQEVLAQLLGEESRDDWEISSGPGLGFGAAGRAALPGSDPLLRLVAPLLNDLMPGQLRALTAGLRNLSILHHERVGCFVPFEMNIR